MSRITYKHLTRLLYLCLLWGNLYITGVNISLCPIHRTLHVSNLRHVLCSEWKHCSVNLAFVFLMAVTVKNTVIWFVTPYSPARVWLYERIASILGGRSVSQANWTLDLSELHAFTTWRPKCSYFFRTIHFFEYPSFTVKYIHTWDYWGPSLWISM